MYLTQLASSPGFCHGPAWSTLSPHSQEATSLSGKVLLFHLAWVARRRIGMPPGSYSLSPSSPRKTEKGSIRLLFIPYHVLSPPLHPVSIQPQPCPVYLHNSPLEWADENPTQLAPSHTVHKGQVGTRARAFLLLGLCSCFLGPGTDLRVLSINLPWPSPLLDLPLALPMSSLAPVWKQEPARVPCVFRRLGECCIFRKLK